MRHPSGLETQAIAVGASRGGRRWRRWWWRERGRRGGGVWRRSDLGRRWGKKRRKGGRGGGGEEEEGGGRRRAGGDALGREEGEEEVEVRIGREERRGTPRAAWGRPSGVGGGEQPACPSLPPLAAGMKEKERKKKEECKKEEGEEEEGKQRRRKEKRRRGWRGWRRQRGRQGRKKNGRPRRWIRCGDERGRFGRGRVWRDAIRTERRRWWPKFLKPFSLMIAPSSISTHANLHDE